jgi:Na+-transporting methylmalonyl-CoA/oxaloacetate decarboxylase gamma subunit
MTKKPSALSDSEGGILVTAAKAIGRVVGRFASKADVPSETPSTPRAAKTHKGANKRRKAGDIQRKPSKKRAMRPNL